MELEEAKKIVKILADGINPTTGASFPKDSPYNEPHVIRALFRIIESKKSGEYQKRLMRKDNRKTLPMADRKMPVCLGVISQDPKCHRNSKQGKRSMNWLNTLNGQGQPLSQN